MSKIIVWVLLMFTMLSMTSVSSAAENRDFGESINDFNWKYFSTLNDMENIFYSPYGIVTALSVAANGAEGATQSEILQAIEAKSIDDLNLSYENLQYTFKNKYNVSGRLFMGSNLILVSKEHIGKGIKDKYKTIVENIYQSDIREADFANNLTGEKQKISSWVSEKTNKFIPNYQSIVTAETIMDILNVVYFKGDWEMPFEADDTFTETFHNSNHSTSNIKFMRNLIKIKYYEDDKYKGVALPYKGYEAEMYLIKPVKDYEFFGYRSFRRNVKEDIFVSNKDLKIANSWNNESAEYKKNFIENIKKSSACKVRIILPKFELDIENALVPNLQAMGIQLAFTDAAKFPNMINDEQLKIDDIKHRAKIKVDETGTEAAAVTEMAMIEATAAAPSAPPIIKTFYANIPFIFVIGDVESSTALFTGAMNNM